MRSARLRRRGSANCHGRRRRRSTPPTTPSAPSEPSAVVASVGSIPPACAGAPAGAAWAPGAGGITPPPAVPVPVPPAGDGLAAADCVGVADDVVVVLVDGVTAGPVVGRAPG